jgi:hypothetical protein
MATTYTLISSVTVGSGGAANIEFTSIPATYTDLVVKLSGRQSGNSGTYIITFNDNTESVYSWRTLYGTGSGSGSQNSASVQEIDPGSNAGNVNWTDTTASTFSNSEIYIPNYTSSNAKSVSLDHVTENNATQSYCLLQAALWNKTNAITKIKFDPNGTETFVQHTTAYLYGISNA